MPFPTQDRSKLPSTEGPLCCKKRGLPAVPRPTVSVPSRLPPRRDCPHYRDCETELAKLSHRSRQLHSRLELRPGSRPTVRHPVFQPYRRGLTWGAEGSEGCDDRRLRRGNAVPAFNRLSVERPRFPGPPSTVPDKGRLLLLVNVFIRASLRAGVLARRGEELGIPAAPGRRAEGAGRGRGEPSPWQRRPPSRTRSLTRWSAFLAQSPRPQKGSRGTVCAVEKRLFTRRGRTKGNTCRVGPVFAFGLASTKHGDFVPLHCSPCSGRQALKLL